jgi:hypothetical protein
MRQDMLMRGCVTPFTCDAALLIAVNIAKLPSVPRQMLKDIPRPPNTASRDDAKAQAVLWESALLRAIFDVGYFPPNTPPGE